SYRWAYVFEANWGDAYSAISSSSDGLRALSEGLEIGPGGERNARAEVFAKFNQAMANCLLALWYDQAFLIDETTDIAGELTTVPYDQVMDAALAKFDEVIGLANASSFNLEPTWINGNPLSNAELADLAVAYKARCRANEARTDAEAASTDWNAVIADATNGLQSLIIDGEDYSSDTPWWDGLKTLMTENATWHRMHMDWAGMADVTGQYQDWLMQPTEQRTARQISTPDTRYPANNVDGEEGSMHRYNATIIFRPERGTYRQSHYGDFRHDEYLNSCSFCFFGPIQHIAPEEMVGYRAEGAYRNGDYATVASLINVTRTAAGLPAVAADATSDVPGGASCVPRKRYDTQGRCGNLRDAMIYEHFETVFNIFGGLEFWHGRRHDILPAGTALHLPIPAADLEVLQEDIYTFGGAGNAGAAGDPTPVVVPGNLDSALERAAYSLARIEQNQIELQRAKSTDLVVR
ncbi:MAG: hypothetical protein MJB57_08060, partial [Gemmatimonadetes bacterium]|nr:hypothetical protein [Gemmatimonadota bacterium]